MKSKARQEKNKKDLYREGGHGETSLPFLFSLWKQNAKRVNIHILDRFAGTDSAFAMAADIEFLSILNFCFEMITQPVLTRLPWRERTLRGRPVRTLLLLVQNTKKFYCPPPRHSRCVSSGKSAVYNDICKTFCILFFIKSQIVWSFVLKFPFRNCVPVKNRL